MITILSPVSMAFTLDDVQQGKLDRSIRINPLLEEILQDFED